MNSKKTTEIFNSPQRRLGEHLVTGGILNTDQLEEAIEYQCIYGGKLGTSLIELGLLSENQLATVLSQQLKLHYIKPELLMNVSAATILLIPKEIALKYQIVPYHHDGKKLYVAINEVSNLANIEELSVQLEHVIIPLAIPEIRLMLALKQYYGMLLSPRFETLAGQMKQRTRAARKKIHKRQTATPSNSEMTIKSETKAQITDNKPWPLLGEENYTGEEPTDENYFAGKDAVADKHSNNLLLQLVNAKERDDIAAAIISYIKKDFPDCAILMVRNNVATGWLAASNQTAQDFDQIMIPLLENSVFNLATTNQSYYLGAVASSLQNLKVLDCFGSPHPVDALVLPLMVRNRLVSLLYIQGQLADLQPQLVKIQKIVAKAEMSFKLLILRNKILTT